jgi:hypothetical protein
MPGEKEQKNNRENGILAVVSIQKLTKGIQMT